MNTTTIVGRGFEFNDSPLFDGPRKVTYGRAQRKDKGWHLAAIEVVEDGGEWKFEREHMIQTNVSSTAVASMLLAWEDQMSQTQGPPTITPDLLAASEASWVSLDMLRTKDRAEQKRLLDGLPAPAKLHIVGGSSIPEAVGMLKPAMLSVMEPEGDAGKSVKKPDPARKAAEGAAKGVAYPEELGPNGKKVYGLGLVCKIQSEKTQNVKEMRLLLMAYHTLTKLAQDEDKCQQLSEYSLAQILAEEASRSSSGGHSCGSGCTHDHHHHGHHHGDGDGAVEPK